MSGAARAGLTVCHLNKKVASTTVSSGIPPQALAQHYGQFEDSPKADDAVVWDSPSNFFENQTSSENTPGTACIQKEKWISAKKENPTPSKMNVDQSTYIWINVEICYKTDDSPRSSK